jgi:hypothetical protein
MVAFTLVLGAGFTVHYFLTQLVITAKLLYGFGCENSVTVIHLVTEDACRYKSKLSVAR